jgi:predicted transcriptional regulator
MEPKCAQAGTDEQVPHGVSEQGRLYLHKVSSLLSDRHVMNILAAMAFKSSSVQEISLRMDIPIAVCYRKIKELVGLELLVAGDKFLTSGGKWTTRYRSNVQKVIVSFETGRYRLCIKLRESPDEMVMTWNPLEDRSEP